MTQFHVGQRVVCIDPHKSTWHRKSFLGIPYIKWSSELNEGSVYTVQEVFVGTEYFSNVLSVGLKLKEVVNYDNSGFRASRFRPVVERKTSIEIFKAMLNKPTVRIDA